MQDKTSDTNLQRLRRYMATEAERLGKCGEGVVHRINLDEVGEEPHCAVRPGPSDPLERDVDLLFSSRKKHRKK